MNAFVDTSALYALMFSEDQRHHEAVACFEGLRTSEAALLSSNYVLLECASLLQRRHGFELAKTFIEKATSLLDVVWIGAQEHQQAAALWTRARSRALSLVDCASFAVMRARNIRCAVAFDEHFAQAGFEVLPHPDRVAESQAIYGAGAKRHQRPMRSRGKE